MIKEQKFPIISWTLLALFVSMGCGPKAEQAKIESPATQPIHSTDDESAEAGHAQFSWIADDWTQAKEQASKLGVPVLIDMWAIWCHSCLSMKHVVLTDPRLKVYKERFVWLEVDTENKVNVPLLEIFEVVQWPTFLIVDPKDNSVLGLQIGSTTVDEFAQFLTHGEAAYISANDPDSTTSLWLASKVAGDTASIARDYATAVTKYQDALQHIPKEHKSRPGIVVALMLNLTNQKDWSACTDVASRESDNIPRGTSTEFISYLTMGCVEHLSPKNPKRVALLAKAETMLTEVVNDDNFDMAVDDRGTAMMTLREILDAQGKHDDALRVAEKQRILLDRAAAESKTPEEAATYNWPRVEVYIYLNRATELIPDLEKSVASLPDNYDPPYRLAWLYFHIQDYEKSLLFATSTAKLSQGPRHCFVLAFIAKIHKEMGQSDLEMTARKQTIETCESLPEGQKRPRVVDLIETQRKLVSEGPSPL